MKRLIAIAVLASASYAQAQNQNQNIPNAPASPAKKELVQRMLTLQQPALLNMARDLVERPVRQMLGAADQVLQTRVAPEKREAVTKQIQEQVRKFRDDSNGLVQDRAVKVGQTSLAPMFEEKFSEEELRQLLATLESPVYKKFQQSLPDLTTAYAQNLIKDLEPLIEPKLKALEQGVGSALGVPAQGAESSAPATSAKPARPAAKPAASAPAKK